MEPIQTGVTENALQEDLHVTIPIIQQRSLDRLSVTNEIRRNDVGTNTSDVEVEQHRDRLGTLAVGANTHTSIPMVDVLLPSSHEDHVRIPNVNLSITGYEPESHENFGRNRITIHENS